jgi:hypothetical protein
VRKIKYLFVYALFRRIFWHRALQLVRRFLQDLPAPIDQNIQFSKEVFNLANSSTFHCKTKICFSALFSHESADIYTCPRGLSALRTLRRRFFFAVGGWLSHNIEEQRAIKCEPEKFLSQSA